MAGHGAIIFVGGDSPHSSLSAHLPGDAHVIAADSGWEHAVRMGLTPNDLVGDMDSIHPVHLEQARNLGACVIEHPRDKDFTDTEIALRRAVEAGCDHITVVSGGGDRFDHLLSMVHAMSDINLPLVAYVGTTRIEFVRPSRDLVVAAGPARTISLVPIGGDAIGVTTSGLRWNLEDDTLRSAASRGVSNEPTHESVTVSVAEGTVAVLQPHFTGENKT